MENIASPEMLEMAEGFAHVKRAVLDAAERGESEYRDNDATGRASNAMAKRRRRLYRQDAADVPYDTLTVAVPQWPHDDTLSGERRGEARRIGCYCAITVTLGVTGELEGVLVEQTPTPDTPTLHVALTRYGALATSLVCAIAEETGPTARLIDPHEALCATPGARRTFEHGGDAAAIDAALGDAMRATKFAAEDALDTGRDVILVWNCSMGGPPDLEVTIAKAREAGYRIALALTNESLETTHKHMAMMRERAANREAAGWYAAHIVDESERLYAHLAGKFGGERATRELSTPGPNDAGEAQDD